MSPQEPFLLLTNFKKTRALPQFFHDLFCSRLLQRHKVFTDGLCVIRRKERIPKELAMLRLVYILILLTFLHPPISSQKTDNDLTQIIETGTLTFGFTTTSLPPFYSDDGDGKFVGLDVDMAYQIAALLGVRPVIDRSSPTYDVLFNNLRTNKIDLVIAKFSTTLDRSMEILYSDPYTVLRRGMFVNKKFLAEKEIENSPLPYLFSQPVRIGAPGTTSHEEFTRTFFPSANVIGYQDRTSMYLDVANGTIDACLYDESGMTKALHQIPELAVYTSAYVFTDQKDYIAIGIAPGHHQLKNWIDTFLREYDIYYTISELVEAYPEHYRGTNL